MMLHAVLMALLLQVAPAAQRPGARASLAGVVVHSGTGEPIANVQVILARTDAPLGVFGDMMVGDHPSGEITLTGDVLAAMADEIAAQTNAGDPGVAPVAAAMAALPLDDLEEIIISPTDGMAVVSKSAPPMMTDSRGRFAFEGVEPGKYKLIFAATGYARQHYGQRTIGGAGIPIVLKAGQVQTDIVMRMIQTGAVSGRVFDTSGRPVAGVPVQLVRFGYDATGQRRPQHTAATETDDRGEYRMYLLSPGRYYLNAGNQPGQIPTGSLPALEVGYVSPNRIAQEYALTYYPGVLDAGAATAIDVQPGADVSGIDLSIGVQHTYRVRGRIMDPGTGQPPPSANISIRFQSPDPIDSFGFGFDKLPSYNAADGSFELRDVSPGAYTVTANLPNPNQPRPPDLASMSTAERTAYFEAMSAAELTRPKASATVNVVNSDVEGVTLTVGTAQSISGRVRIDPGASKPEAHFDFLQIQLQPADGAPVDPANAPQSRPAKADGTFRIDNIWPGEYRLFAAGIPSGFYMKEARAGDADVLNRVLRFTGADSSTLDIVISPNVGQIDGTVVDQRGQPVPGAQVVLLPDRNRNRADLFRPVTSDSAGHFAISDVTPGDYRLAGWEAIEPFAFFDPDLIKQAEQSGKSIRIPESSTQTVSISPIPSRP